MSIDKIAKAKAALIIDQPFFAALLLGMPMHESTQVPTMGTDGKQIVYSPAFVDKLRTDELVFVLAHEVMHAALLHCLRLEGRDRMRWNIATDLCINQILASDKVGQAPQGVLRDDALVAKGNGMAEQVYNLLPPLPPSQGGGKGKGKAGQGQGYPEPGEPGGPLDDLMPGAADAAEQAQQEAEWKIKVAQARDVAKMQGKLSANLQRLVGELVKPKVDWKQVLRRFFTDRVKTDWSYARPKRRFLAEDIYLPGMLGEGLGEIVIAVDCSGSIGGPELDAFAAEILGICEDTKPRKVHVFYFDSKVLRHDQFERGQAPEIRPCGGGGTAFSPIFQDVAEAGIVPSACVVLTDLRCSDFGQQPGYPVLWTTTYSEVAPWGEIVKMQK